MAKPKINLEPYKDEIVQWRKERKTIKWIVSELQTQYGIKMSEWTLSDRIKEWGIQNIWRDQYQIGYHFPDTKLTYLGEAGIINGKRQVKVQCDCGSAPFICSLFNIKDKKKKSCGCLSYKKKVEYKKEEHIPNTYFTYLGEVGFLKNNHHRLIEVRCQCGNILNVDLSNIRSGNTKSCGCIKSRGEKTIATLLRENRITFEKQKTFSDCKDIHLLPFDFYVDNHYLIEYDGIQHFEVNISVGWNNKENFQITKKHDLIKNKWCKEHSIPLIRIPYTTLNNLTIEDLKLQTSSYIV